MDTTAILIFLIAVLIALLLVIVFAVGRPVEQPKAEYVLEVPYPNSFAYWPSPYYYGWTSGGSWYPSRYSDSSAPLRPGHRTTYGYGSGWSSGGGHGGSGHGGGGSGHGGGGHH